MAWHEQSAADRIDQLKKSTPPVEVSDYLDGYLPIFESRAAEALAEGYEFKDKPLFNLKPSEGVLVDGVHIYANLVNFEDYLTISGDESSHAHRRTLNFLHLHYSSCDRVVENCGARRVDFHSGRMHAVITEPTGAGNEGIRVARAIVLAEQLRKISAGLSASLRGGDYSSEYRFGIDTGLCVAINSGRGSEPEPLFLGSAANHAAKLADGDKAGIFLSDKAQLALNLSGVPINENRWDRSVDGRQSYQISEDYLAPTLRLGSQGIDETSLLLENWLVEIRRGGSSIDINPAKFDFHIHELPLRTIAYKNLMPSKSIRMDTVSIFADLDGYTAYIDQAMADRTSLGNAVRNMHVIRRELANVLHQDFEGRKVRFIGDCIHGIVATGKHLVVDEMGTVRSAILCAGAMRSSFELCQARLVGADQLGLAIGIELGKVPITRLGIRGERSVRVASSSSTIRSEEEQKRSSGFETAIGERAFLAGSHAVRSLFGVERKTNDLFYDDALLGIPASVSAPAIMSTEPKNEFRAHVER